MLWNLVINWMNITFTIFNIFVISCACFELNCMELFNILDKVCNTWKVIPNPYVTIKKSNSWKFSRTLGLEYFFPVWLRNHLITGSQPYRKIMYRIVSRLSNGFNLIIFHLKICGNCQYPDVINNYASDQWLYLWLKTSANWCCFSSFKKDWI